MGALCTISTYSEFRVFYNWLLKGNKIIFQEGEDEV
jgi:hypothetical protein